MLKDFKKKQETRINENTADKLRDVNQQLHSYLGKDNSSLTHLEIIGYLGEGTYALVNLALDNHLSKKVALKIFEKSTLIVNRRLSNLMVG